MSSIIQRIQKDPIKFSQSTLGKLFLWAYNKVPSTYQVSQYKPSKSPIRIVFSGMGDSDIANYAKSRFLQRYKNTYVFGHPQLNQALQFSKNIHPDTPVIVYGYSWGSTAARDFIDQYNGNIVGAHFLDPMRKHPKEDKNLYISKNIPVTYTKANQYTDDELKQSLLNALRWKPTQNMRVLNTVTDHGAIQQWLDNLDKSTKMKKQAYLKLMNTGKLLKKANVQYPVQRYQYPMQQYPVQQYPQKEQGMPTWLKWTLGILGGGALLWAGHGIGRAKTQDQIATIKRLRDQMKKLKPKKFKVDYSPMSPLEVWNSREGILDMIFQYDHKL